jgi:hypothetical protein
MAEIELWDYALKLLPVVGIYLASITARVLSNIVREAVAWIRERIEKRLGHTLQATYIHLMSAAVSLAVVGGGLRFGDLLSDEAMAALPQPWAFLAFSLIVFLRAGGWIDEQRQLLRGQNKINAPVSVGTRPVATSKIVERENS